MHFILKVIFIVACLLFFSNPSFSAIDIKELTAETMKNGTWFFEKKQDEFTDEIKGSLGAFSTEVDSESKEGPIMVQFIFSDPPQIDESAFCAPTPKLEPPTQLRRIPK